MDINNLPVGIYGDDGSPCYISLGDGGSLLVAGNPRTGKGTFIQALLVSLCSIPPDKEKIAVLSPKAEVDYQNFAPRCLLITDYEEMLSFLEEIQEETSRRKKYCVERNIKKITPEHFLSGLEHLTIIFDEFAVVRAAQIPGEKKPRPIGTEIEDLLIKLVAESAAFALSFAIVIQKAQFNTALRDLLHGTRCCFSVSTAEAAKMVFGDLTPFAPCQTIPVAAKGIGYISTLDEPIPRLFKGSMPTEAQEIDAGKTGTYNSER